MVNPGRGSIVGHSDKARFLVVFSVFPGFASSVPAPLAKPRQRAATARAPGRRDASAGGDARGSIRNRRLTGGTAFVNREACASWRRPNSRFQASRTTSEGRAKTPFEFPGLSPPEISYPVENTEPASFLSSPGRVGGSARSPPQCAKNRLLAPSPPRNGATRRQASPRMPCAGSKTRRAGTVGCNRGASDAPGSTGPARRCARTRVPRQDTVPARWLRATATFEAAVARTCTARRRAVETRARAVGEEHEQRRRSRPARAQESGAHGATAGPRTGPGPDLHVSLVAARRDTERETARHSRGRDSAYRHRTGAGPTSRERGRRRRPRAAPTKPPRTHTGVWRSRCDHPK